MNTSSSHESLLAFLKKIPGISPNIDYGVFESGLWWIKFRIDIDHPLAWNVVQELGQILNYISITEPLPCVFKPVSPPVYLNGGPKDFLSWVIESTDISFTPDLCLEWLEGRLPNPVDDLTTWKFEEEDEDDE